MKHRKKIVNRGLKQLETEIEDFMKSISYDDNIRMHFLELSAKYLGVYVENKSINSLNNNNKRAN